MWTVSASCRAHTVSFQISKKVLRLGRDAGITFTESELMRLPRIGPVRSPAASVVYRSPLGLATSDGLLRSGPDHQVSGEKLSWKRRVLSRVPSAWSTARSTKILRPGAG